MSQLRLPGGDGGRPPMRFLAFMGFCLELMMGTLFYGIYTDTIGLMSNVYLSELPGIGQLFGLIDEEMTVSHLLAAMLAFFSCAVPVYIWSVILNEKIYEEPRAWLSKPLNQIKAGFMLFIFVLVFALEVTNQYTLIAQHKNAGPLPTGDDGDLSDARSEALQRGRGGFQRRSGVGVVHDRSERPVEVEREHRVPTGERRESFPAGFGQSVVDPRHVRVEERG